MDKLLLGIDFGTSTNFVTKYDVRKKEAVDVENMEEHGGNNIFENCIYIDTKDNFVLGKRKRALSDPEHFFDDIKRYIIDDKKKYFVPKLDKTLTPQDIAQLIFETIKKKVESNENKEIDGVVITVPYAYGKTYRQRIKEAAEKAGLKVIRLVEEPVAAAISFGLFDDNIQNNKQEKIVVFDFGGGTFDITVFKFEKSDHSNAKIEVLNTDGVEKLGGRTIDELLVRKFMEKLEVEYVHFQNPKERAAFQNQMMEIAKDTKEILSVQSEEEIFESLVVNGENKVLDFTLTRDEFNEWLKDNNIIGEIKDALERAIDDINLDEDDIDRVILAGGSSSIPIIKELVEDFFGKKVESKNDLGKLVGRGAGILAGLTEDNSLNYSVIRKTSKHIGIAKGNKFYKILLKNSKYDEESEPKKAVLKNKDDELIVSFYEGDEAKIEDCEKIGQVLIDGKKFSSNEIFISLIREDKNATKLKAKFYDKNKKLVQEVYLEDV